MHTESDRKVWLSDMAKLGSQGLDASRATFRKLAAAFAPHVPPSHLDAYRQAAQATLKLQTSFSPVAEAVAPLVEEGKIRLWSGPWEYGDLTALHTVVDEIILRKEYYFQTSQRDALVIDAGANFGMATYYVKRMGLASRVICFEPNPECYQRLMRNVAANRFTGVEIHNAALGETDGEANFYFSSDRPLAGSLSPRNAKDNIRCEPTVVRRLSTYLDQPVALLKLDIEGAEADVLEEASGRLAVVENVFCEVHPVHGETPSLLTRTLAVLEQAGFYVHVGRSPWSERAHAERPLTRASHPYSLSVFATRNAARPAA